MGWSTRSSSTIPAVLAALLDAVARTLPDVQVCDGMPVGDVADDIVAIGATGRPGEVAVQASRTGGALTTAPDAESFDVSCVASSWRGAETDFAPVRAGLFAMLDAIAGEIAKDPTLGGATGLARMTVTSFFQEQVGVEDDEGTPSGAGAVATAIFTVHCDGWTR
ncbi:hypothetical protein [Actinomadura nitritigenes]|uniref:hypothetical protein n=1 Tax=Actinomadura nitritigenes TaxID=134602 RepID=UPI003D8A50A8